MPKENGNHNFFFMFMITGIYPSKSNPETQKERILLTRNGNFLYKYSKNNMLEQNLNN